MSLSASSPGIWTSRSDATSRRVSIDSTVARTRRVVCLSRKRCAGAQRVVGHPADLRLQPPRHLRGVVRPAHQVAAADVEVVGRHHGDRHRRERLRDRALRPVDALDRRAVAGREHDHLVARAQHAARHLPRVAAVVVLRAAARADRQLHREARGVEVAVGGDLDLLEVLEQRRPVVVGRVRGALDDVVALAAPTSGSSARPAPRAAPSSPGSRRRSRGSGPRPSRRGPSCSRTRPCGGSRAGRRCTRAGATARAAR